MYANIYMEFSKTYRFCVAHTEQEIGTILQIYVYFM